MKKLIAFIILVSALAGVISGWFSDDSASDTGSGNRSYAESRASSYELSNRTNRSYAANVSSRTTTKDQTKCYKCSGTGVCPECHGTRKNNFTGVLAAMGCTLCDKTGKCCRCDGTGKIYY